MDKASKIIKSLYYPAVLGAMLVFLLQKLLFDGIALLQSPALYWAVLLLVFFSKSYAEIVAQEEYSIWHVLIDSTEIILIFVAFFFLGFLTDTHPQAAFQPPAQDEFPIDLAGLFITLILVLQLQQVWNWVSWGKSDYWKDFSIKDLLSLSNMISIILGICLLANHLSEDKHTIAWVSFGISTLALIGYFVLGKSTE